MCVVRFFFSKNLLISNSLLGNYLCVDRFVVGISQSHRLTFLVWLNFIKLNNYFCVKKQNKTILVLIFIIWQTAKTERPKKTARVNLKAVSNPGILAPLHPLSRDLEAGSGFYFRRLCEACAQLVLAGAERSVCSLLAGLGWVWSRGLRAALPVSGRQDAGGCGRLLPRRAGQDL